MDRAGAEGQSYETSRDTQSGEAEGVAFTGTKAVSRRRRRTQDRMVYGGIAHAEEFGERWYGECLRYDTLDAYHLQKAAREASSLFFWSLFAILSPDGRAISPGDS